MYYATQIYEEHLMTKWKYIYQNLQTACYKFSSREQMWHKDLFSLARDSVWLDSLNQLPPASLHSLGDNLPGKGFDCFRPSSDAEKDYNRSCLFYKWASYLLVSKSSLQMEGWNFFTRGKKIYICQKFWLKTSCRSTNFF